MFDQQAQQTPTNADQMPIPGTDHESERAMKETPEDKDVRDGVFNAAAAELRQFVERYERLEAEKKDIADAQKEVMAHAKARGYDPKIMRQLIALRKRDENDVAEEQATLDMYKSALGMS
jgi:uncharacterized protein (UPF0335 family)